MNPFKTLLATTLWTCLLGQAARGDSTYTYTLESGKATITGFVTGVTPSGAVMVPATVDSYAVVGIGRSAFKDRTAITTVSFASGASVTQVGASAFAGCAALQTVVLPTGITKIPAGAFQGCSNLTSVTIPAAVTAIGAAAFDGCGALTAVSLPSGLTSLGESAFFNCRSLSSLTVPSGVTTIPSQAFGECRALASLSLSAGITAIGDAALAGCVSLSSFTLPAAVTRIDKEAFRGCSGLTGFTANGTLNAIGDRAFEGCRALASITVPSANTSFSSGGGVLFDKNGATLLLCPAALAGTYSIPSAVSNLAPGAFSHCTALTTVTIPAALGSVGVEVFYYASGIKNLVIPEGITAIGSWAVAGCTGLGDVTLPASLTSVGANAFYGSALNWALFNGNAPAVGAAAFDLEASGFTVYFYSARTGFTTPVWQGYAAASLDAAPSIVNWLTGNGFNPGTALLSDPNGDGVNLLLAYALGLDPNANLTGSLPQPVLSGGSLTLAFHGASTGITYGAETSADLITWSSSGVTLSSPDATGSRTATLPVGTDGSPRFMRLVVGY